MRRSTKGVLGCLVGAGALILLSVILLDLRAKAAVRRHEEAVHAILTELQTEGPQRAPCFGTPLPGRGRDLYLQAAATLAGIEYVGLQALPEMEFQFAVDPDDE